MRFILGTPPPLARFAGQFPLFKSKGKLGKINKFAFFNNFYERVALAPKDLPTDIDYFVLSACYHGMQGPMFGFNLKRKIRVFLLDEDAKVDDFVVGDWSWITGGIRAQEAMMACEKADMSLQGIRYTMFDNEDSIVRIFRPSLDEELKAFRYSRDDRMLEELPLERLQEHPVDVQLMEETMRITDHHHGFTEHDAMMLAHIDTYVETLSWNFGFFVSNIWRMSKRSLEMQAAAFDMTRVEYLMEKIENRKKAAARWIK